MTEEWGPWIEHDGKGYPPDVIGQVCQAVDVCRVRGVFFDGEEFVCYGQHPDGGSWNWENFPEITMILRYRIRKPRALIQLIDMVENLPAPTERVDA